MNYIHNNTGGEASRQNVLNLKRKMTLDLTNAKRARALDVLCSPDVQKLQIPTPELERMIMNTAPGPLLTPTSYQKFEKTVKHMQDQYNVPRSFQDEGRSYEDFSNAVVKKEPQVVPDRALDSFTDSDYSDGRSMVGGVKPTLPVDIESQEKMKLERKRQRNRVAASKCRSKKLERIANLEEKVKDLKNENSDLEKILAKLQNGIHALKSQVFEEHIHAGCKIAVQGRHGLT